VRKPFAKSGDSRQRDLHAVEQAFRLPRRYACRHSPKNIGTDADVAT
jgi:hypothetical protein